MKDIRKIIVPVDFQKHTEELADYAIGVADRIGASVTLFHVVENVAFYADFLPSNFSRQEEQTYDHANKKMRILVEICNRKLTHCTGQVYKGDIVDTILQFTEDEEIDLIVMATHGARGIEKILLGSVAERVIKRAKCPVLVFKSQK
jgi:nucleotide-binding universal stress UspA family protein